MSGTVGLHNSVPSTSAVATASRDSTAVVAT